MDPIHKEELLEIAACFERQFTCHFCLHRHNSLIHRHFWDIPFDHRNHVCLELKRLGGATAQQCIQFDAKYVHSYAQNVSGLFFKRCHWGVIELVIPLRLNGALVGTLFAGPYRMEPGTSLPEQVCALSKPKPPDSAAALADLPLLDRDKAKAMMVFGKLLGERFNAYLEQEAVKQLPDSQPLRQTLLDFLDANFCRSSFCLDDLALFLNHSRTHTCRLVRKTCGEGFATLLLGKRLAAVTKLLTDSDYPMKTIASLSGFASAEYLHRVFKRHFSVTPGEFRAKNTRHLSDDTPSL